MDLDAQVILLKGDDFFRWGREVHFCQSAVVPIFWQPPSCDYLQKQFRVEYWHVTSESWPEELRAILHLYDDVDWELYSVVESDVQALIRVHKGDTRLSLYYIDLETEYPYPTNRKLVPVD